MNLQIFARAAFAMLGMTILALSGCWSSTPSRVMPQAIDSGAAQKAIELYDANKDGVLDAGELEKAPGLKAAIKQVDKNNDGKISADEIDARINDWKESKLGRTVMSCIVTHNGKPLDGATVNFVPESFLGGELKTGTGTTDAGGVANITQSSDPPGMSPGFYRVEITKAGEKIPAKYNTQTTLGQEVAADAQGILEGINFDLKY